MSDINEDLLTKAPLSTAKPWWQKPAFTISVALLGLALIIITITINVAKYETHLANGDTVLLKLAPVDPRGFMQGDYMTLSHALETDVLNALRDRLSEDEYRLKAAEGYIIVALDANNVGHFVALAADKPNNLTPQQMAIYYRVRNNSLKLATNAFFFQEGHAEAFEAAEYGLFRINDKGAPLLTAMVDSDFAVIIPKDKNAEDE